MIDVEYARQEAPVRLEALREINPRHADWIDRVYSEVLHDLRREKVEDTRLVDWLWEAIEYGMQERAN